MSFLDKAMFTATLAGKGKEPPASLLLPSSSEPSLLLNSSSTLSSTLSSFPSSYITSLASAEFSSKMPTKNANIPFQPFNKLPSTIANANTDSSMHTAQQEKPKEADSTSSSSSSRRRLPLPTKLSFEQNITHLIEKESPLLQSELLTAEHELSVLRSRLAVNEGVTAITGTILESLKDQFDSHRKVDRTTSPFDVARTNLLQQSSANQTSPLNETLPDSLEIHYDAESPKSPYLLVKAVNSYWIAQPIDDSQVQAHLNRFSSPVMKRATIKLPDSFDLDSDSDDNEQKIPSQHSISDEDESLPIDRYEQLSEMKTIRSSSLFPNDNHFDSFDNKIEEIYAVIDHLKHNSLTAIAPSNLEKEIHDLKSTLHNTHLNKQDELRVEYELDELESLCNQTSKHADYNFLELFEQNLNELEHLIEHIKTIGSLSQRDLIAELEDKLESIPDIDDDARSNDQKFSPKPSPKRLIPENPVITSDVFFEGDKTPKTNKATTTSPHTPRLIPEDARVNASSFYEGDLTRSLYQHAEPSKDTEHVLKRASLIPERPAVSGEVFYEGDAQRSLFAERALGHQTEPIPSMAIDNLRQIMSDLMLAASWSKKPTRFDKQQTKDDEETVAESFITTERRHSKSSLCEIIHEIEQLPSSHPAIVVEEQTNMPLHPTIIEEDEPSSEKSREQEENLGGKKSPNEVAFIFVSPPSLEQDEDELVESAKTSERETTNQSEENETQQLADYEHRLRQTSNEVVGKVLNDVICEAIEHEQEELYHLTAVQLVQEAITNALIKYDNELGLTDSSSSTTTTTSDSDGDDDSDGYLSSDDEENEKLIPHTADQPYLFVTDVVTSKSTQELGDLVQELQTLEHQIHGTQPRSSSSSGSSDDDHTSTSHIFIPQIMTTKSVNELTDLVAELQDMEEKLEDKFDSPFEPVKPTISSKSFNELDGLINELNTVSKHLNDRIQEEIFICNNIDSLSEDIVKYRRDSLATDRRSSSPLVSTSTDEQRENQSVQEMVASIIKEAQDIVMKESNAKSIPTIVVQQRRVSCQRSSATSISDDTGLSHEDNSADQSFELAAQLDYLRRMSRYDNVSHEQSALSVLDRHNNDNENEEFKSVSYLTMVDEETMSSDDDVPQKSTTEIGQHTDISQESITQPSSDSLDYHSTEVDINQLETRRTTSELSLHSTSSSLHPYERQSLSTLCLIDKDELSTPEPDLDRTATTDLGFFDRMKLLVSKPLEMVQETMDNLGITRPNEFIAEKSHIPAAEQHQHFQSAYDLHDEEKSKLVRSPELYNIGNVIKHDPRSLLSSTQIQYRTLSESALGSNESKRHSLTTTSNDASVEFLTALSKEDSAEFTQQRLSTPFDDVPEKESSPEQSESSHLPMPTFSDAVEPTSSCQRPLAFRVPGQQSAIREEDYLAAANELVNQVLTDVVSELSGEQDGSSLENTSERVPISSSSASSDDEDDKLPEIDEEEAEELIPEPPPPPPPLLLTAPPKTSARSPFCKVLRRAQTDTRHFDIDQSPISLVPPNMRRNSQSDTDVYFRAVSPSLHEYRQMQNSSSEDESFNRLRIEKYSGEGEESSGGRQRTTWRRKRSAEQTNIHETLGLKFEFGDDANRRDSLDSPPKDSTEKSLMKILQEGILRTNLQSLQSELQLNSPQKDHQREDIYATVMKKPAANYDYDGGSETDRDESASQTISGGAKVNPVSTDTEARSLLEELVESMNDDLPKSISSDPASSQSDATTVIFNSNKNSIDEEEQHLEQTSLESDLQAKQLLSIHPSSSSSASSSHSVIYHQQDSLSQMPTNRTSIVHTQAKKPLSTPSFTTSEPIGQCPKTKFRSYPSSLGTSHILSPSSTTSILPEDYSIPATSLTEQSGQQRADE